MKRYIISHKRSLAIIIIITIIPFLYLIWLSSNPTLVNHLIQSAETVHQMSMFEQISAVIGGFIYKPIHMVLSLIIIWALRQSKSTDLITLRWGLLSFLLGESFCAVNYLIFNHTSYFTEFLHGYGMVVGFAFTFYALIDGLDNRILKFSSVSKKCSALEICGQCIKVHPVPCGIRRILLLVLPVMAIISMFPMAAQLQSIRYQTIILETSYVYEWPLLYQYFEARFAPILAFLMFISAWVAMYMDRRSPVPDIARILASIGFGSLSFGILRFTLKTIFFENIIWADYWEELTELIFIVAVAVILLLFFQRLFHEVLPGRSQISIWHILKPGGREKRLPPNSD